MRVAAKLILVVGGDSALAELVRDVVEPEVNAIVRLVSTAEPALVFVRNLRPALILLDELVPDGAGPALCRRLRANCSLVDVPIILLEPDPSSDDALAAGASAYLRKPVSEEALARAIRRRI
jgi:CheY-like chemotaxis protein